MFLIWTHLRELDRGSFHKVIQAFLPLSLEGSYNTVDPLDKRRLIILFLTFKMVPIVMVEMASICYITTKAQKQKVKPVSIMESDEKPNPLWYALPCEAAFKHLHSSPEGLESKEVQPRLKKFGYNCVQIRSSENILWMILRQFHNPLVYILLASTVMALSLGKIPDALVVLSVVIVNSLTGFIQEYRSGKTIRALLQMIPQKSTVIRNGDSFSVPSSEIVPGDIMVIEAGERVAADIRLFSVNHFTCDESALTGESVPVVKRSDPVPEDAIPADRKSMAYGGTLVTSGTATGIVVATGVSTEFGKISELLEQVSVPETPLTLSLGRIARWITLIVFLFGAGLFGVGYLRGYSMLDAGIAAIALAVAAIPEGLPVAITIASTIGVQRMARRKALIRHLPAVETLGSTTVICTDKTGTLTQNRMTVQSIWTPEGSFFVTGSGTSPEGQILSCDRASNQQSDGEDAIRVLTAAVLCNDASIGEGENGWIFNGDPTELALIVAGRKGGLHEDALREQWPRMDVIPFESGRGIMATLHLSPLNKKMIFLKGAPEEVIRLCQQSADSRMQSQLENMAGQGMRVIAVATKDFSFDHPSLEEGDIKGGFTLLGFLGMTDPPRLEVPKAVKACQKAGITVKMITGDHPLTAGVVGRALGLSGDARVITGCALDRLTPQEWKEVIHQNNVFARVLPEQKLKIIEILQASNHVVAMTGDGVNDAPALKRANIGVAMGIGGTAVAREASDMVLADDNFASIEAAVEEGRRVYDNLIKSIVFMFPTNLAQALVILVAVLFFPIHERVLLLPILPVQILWVNLVTALALTLPLAFEAMEPDIMQRPPRKTDAPILDGFVVFRTLIVAALMTMGTIGLFFWEYSTEIAKGTLEETALSEAQTMAVTTLMFLQIFYLFHCRSFRGSIFGTGFFSNPYVLLGIGFVLLTQMAFVYVPFMNALFGSSPLSLEAWLTSIFVALFILPVISFEKWIVKRFFSK